MAKESKNKDIKKEEKNSKNASNKTTKQGGFKEFKSELKKVVWPTPKELLNSTTAVIVIVLITAIIVFFLDVVFEKVNTYGIDAIRNTVSSSVNKEEENKVSQEEVVESEDVSEPSDADVTVEEENTAVQTEESEN